MVERQQYTGLFALIKAFLVYRSTALGTKRWVINDNLVRTDSLSALWKESHTKLHFLNITLTNRIAENIVAGYTPCVTIQTES